MIVVTKQTYWIDPDWLNAQEDVVLKYTPLTKFYRTKHYLDFQDIIDYMVGGLHHQHKSILVDFKIRSHEIGDSSCPVSGWHYDCVKDYNHPSKHEHHVIFSSSDPTEFLVEDKVMSFHGVVEYGRDLHRGSVITKNGKRVLIRITETDNIK